MCRPLTRRQLLRYGALAAATCEQLGHADVRLLAGGLEAWQAAGGTVIEGWGVAGKAYGERVAASGAVPVSHASPDGFV